MGRREFVEFLVSHDGRVATDLWDWTWDQLQKRVDELMAGVSSVPAREDSMHPPEAINEAVTLEAHRLVTGPRGKNYGHPIDDFTRTAELWSPILGVNVTAEQVAMCMIEVKIARLIETPTHRDSIVDIAGYAETLDMVRQRRAEDVY